MRSLSTLSYFGFELFLGCVVGIIAKKESVLFQGTEQRSNKTAKHHQSASRKALPLGTAFASVAGLLAAAAVDGNPLVFTPDEYAVGNAGQSDQYVDVQLPDGTVVRLPAGQYVISPEGLLVPLVNGTDDFDGDGLVVTFSA